MIVLSPNQVSALFKDFESLSCLVDKMSVCLSLTVLMLTSILIIILNFEISAISHFTLPRVLGSNPYSLIDPFGNVSRQFPVRFLPLNEERINFFK